MKRYFLAIIFLGVLLTTLQAQAPRWVEYNQRERMYPSDEYLIGFASASDVAYTDLLMEELVGAAKKELIESIKVSISSESSIKIEAVNTKSNSEYLNRTVSYADADIVGLKSDTYFDSKKKVAYAFVYASYESVKSYYSSFIALATSEVRLAIDNATSFASSGSYGDALTTLLDADNKLFEVKQAQGLLLAMAVEDELTLKVNTTSQLQREVLLKLDEVLKSDGLSIENLSDYLSYRISTLEFKEEDQVFAQASTYSDYPLKSSFGDLLDNYLQEQSKKREVPLVSDQNGTTYTILANYYEAGKDVQVSVNVMAAASGDAVASFNGRVAVSQLESKGIEYVPIEIRKLRTLGEAKLTPQPKTVEVKFNEAIDQPFKMVVTGGSGQPLEGIPFNYQHKTISDIKGDVSSNASGLVEVAVQKISQPKKLQFLNLSVDVGRYLNMQIGDEILERLKADYKVPKTNFIIKLKGLALYIDANETLLGESYQQKMVSNKLKQTFTELGFHFVDDPDGADYYMEVQVASNSGGEFQGLYFSYANVTVSLTNLGSGDEIFTKSYNDIKGGGGSFKSAALKAYTKASNQVSEEIKTQFQ
ncbi:MAG: hypothetical protein KI790_05975 [Cyclobacteriaceae bacterium]|nr:hypothetical protein [Cyclobacteriaceae bacterium HetDA_MAG_MS6]